MQAEPQPTTAPAATQVIIERPEHGLARGQYAWPEWGIALAGGLCVVAALVYLALRLRTRRAR